MKLYSIGFVKPLNEETNKLLLDIYDHTLKIKEYLSDEKYEKYVVALHNKLREKLEMPNKIFALAVYEGHTKVRIEYFDKEPDDRVYAVYVDEENRIPYIIINESEV